METSPKNIRPWVRFWARVLDYLIWGAIISFCIYGNPFIFWYHIMSFNFSSIYTCIFLIFSLMSLVPIEAFLLSTWGYTPGKWLLMVTIRDNNGNKLSYRKALKRAVAVFIFGIGLGIPIITIIALFMAHYKLTKDSTTLWDESGKYAVTHDRIGPIRVIILVIILLAFMQLPLILWRF